MKLKTPNLNLSTLPYAIYARLSDNPDGTRDSTETQVALGIRDGEARWPGRPYVVFVDDDLTAADTDVFRPQYEAMLDGIRRGQIGDVLAKNQARISRHELIWPEFKAACLVAGIGFLHTWTEGVHDLIQSLSSDILNLVNAEYAKQAKINVNTHLDERAREGRPSGGKPYAYEHKKDELGRSRLAVVEGRDLVVKEAARRMLAGENLTDIVNDFNTREIRPARAEKWNITSLKGAVLSPTNAGHRVHRGKIVGKAEWEPVLDELTWLALKAKYGSKRTKIVNGEERPVPKKNRKARKYMLSGGPMRCGLCAAVLYGKSNKSNNGKKFVFYQCVKSLGGCGKLGIVAGKVDEWVTNEFLDFIDTPAFAAMIAAGDVDADERDALLAQKAGHEAQRVATAMSVARQEITLAMAGLIEAGIDDEIGKIDRRLAELAPVQLSSSPEAIRETFLAGSPDERRSILLSFGCDVVVAPAFGPRRFNEFRLDIWFDDMGERPSDANRLMMRRKMAMASMGI